MKRILIIVACVSLFVSGCATLWKHSSGVVPVGDDTFMISTTIKGFEGSGAHAKADALKEGNEYCRSMDKTLSLVSFDQKDMVVFTSDARAEIIFRCK